MNVPAILAALVAFSSSPSGAFAGALAVVPAVAGAAPVPVYIARPEGTGPFPAVLLLHGCEGFNGFVAVAADRLAARGYVAVALDSLGLRPPLSACGTKNGSSDEAEDARSALTWLRLQPYVEPDRLAAIGYSMGANAVLKLVDPHTASTAAPTGLRAAVAFYPACDGNTFDIAVPLQIFDGDADIFAPSAACSRLVDAAKAAGKRADITVYSGATHGFLIPGPERTFFGEPIRYDAAAATDSAQKIERFFSAYLK